MMDTLQMMIFTTLFVAFGTLMLWDGIDKAKEKLVWLVYSGAILFVVLSGSALMSAYFTDLILWVIGQ